MKDRFPRTAAEFAEAGRLVVLRCAAGHTNHVRPESLIQRFGPDFDLYRDDPGFALLLDAFPCACRAEQMVSIYQPDAVDHFRPVSREEALAHDLERRAFARARDTLKPRGLRWDQGGLRPSRRFGGSHLTGGEGGRS